MVVYITNLIIIINYIRAYWYLSDYSLSSVDTIISNKYTDTICNIFIIRPIGLVIKSHYLLLSFFLKKTVRMPIYMYIIIPFLFVLWVLFLTFFCITKLFIDIIYCVYKVYTKHKKLDMGLFFVEINQTLYESLVVKKPNKKKYNIYIIDRCVYLNTGDKRLFVSNKQSQYFLSTIKSSFESTIITMVDVYNKNPKTGNLDKHKAIKQDGES